MKANFGPRWGQMWADSGIWRFLAENSATRRSSLLWGGSGPRTCRGVHLDPVKTPVTSNKRQPPGTSREAGVAGMILSTLPFSRKAPWARKTIRFPVAIGLEGTRSVRLRSRRRRVVSDIADYQGRIRLLGACRGKGLPPSQSGLK